jgi:predicted small lipoprotein YifL
MLTLGRFICLCAAATLVASAGCGEKKPLAGSTPPPPPVCAPSPRHTYDYSQKVLNNVKLRADRKWTVAILRFGDTKDVEDVPFGATSAPSQVGNGDVNVNVNVGNDRPAVPVETPPRMNKRAREILKNELVKSGAFTVVERERILDIIREINFGKTKYVNSDASGDHAALLPVKYLIEGSLGWNMDKTLKDNIDNDRTYKDAGDYRPGVSANVLEPGKVNREKMLAAIRQMEQERANNSALAEFHISCYLSAYNVHTGEVVTSVMGLGANGLEAINDAVEDLITSLSALDNELHVAAIGENGVYIDAGANGGIKPGARFVVTHQGKAILDKDGQVIGHEEKEVGQIEVTDVQPLMSTAKVVNKTGDMARGDLVKGTK